jgi:hypothetical protein
VVGRQYVCFSAGYLGDLELGMVLLLPDVEYDGTSGYVISLAFQQCLVVSLRSVQPSYTDQTRGQFEGDATWRWKDLEHQYAVGSLKGRSEHIQYASL